MDQPARHTGQNPPPPSHYTASAAAATDDDGDLITGESLVQAVRAALENPPDTVVATRKDEEDTVLEQRLASVWDAASLTSYAYQFIEMDAHELLLDIIAPNDSEEKKEKEDDSREEGVAASIEFKYRARTVELALGALANLASWSDVAGLLLTNTRLCTTNARILAQSGDAPMLTEACRLVLAGWSVVVRLVDMLRCTQHLPLRLAALETLRWCVLLEPTAAAHIPLDDLADWMAGWLQSMDAALESTQQLKERVQRLINALPE
ncbi:hypothetical protein SYNPS1DRAFT_26657 [Syncephalis pseudoplumigaleata]|uniref:Armadillo-type protein n=1 Tax=Syncephalis pseudoplumigaleata TaxID=1712513 RepID=A0A4V1J288_9FUNG|nr:hypothetical protein SYNPS1DRAFT_26657 [Syncephalis pseudoplumigaleata]|eukprot:RKP27709.1 hypothetical protein SYNPS1DRAFT_26657 [Syncephalis pseudoplumigaleata]